MVEYLTLRDLATQFSEVTGEKASLALELTPEQFEASRHADHPAAELMYLSWEYVKRAGPDSGVRVRVVGECVSVVRNVLMLCCAPGSETDAVDLPAGEDVPRVGQG